ncbi:hypothetical protein NDU88_005362 [Pleurodeles waltl]|uniref:Uncharacterized protein n=1 Tax=Pleurodeles waltl TaxID=8319 RepID=A0AAV7ULN2_PLEWA|nr:hypothetical protein NDU88_005362 [Pleurodeles waltl]
MEDYTLPAGGDGCSVVAVPMLVSVLPVVGVGSSPSPAVSDGCPLGLLLLAVVLVAVQVLVQVPVLVAELAVVGGGSSPSPAPSDGCPLGLLLLAVVLVAVQVEVQVAVQVPVRVLVLPVVGVGSSPSPSVSEGSPLGLLLMAVVLVALQVALQVAVQVPVLVAVLVAVLPVVGGRLQPFPSSLGQLPTGAAAGSGARGGAGSVVGRLQPFPCSLRWLKHHGAWVGCCCEVDGCWVSECWRLCTLGGRNTDTGGEDIVEMCMDVGVMTASEGRVVIGVMVMEAVDVDVVHAGVSGDTTGREVDDEEEGDTVEAVDVGVSASGWCLCECL